MKSSIGPWVSRDNFFARERDLQILKTRVRDGNHVLLTGQRRMGKTSIARELGRRLEAEGWVFLFADVEGATCAEDVIADIAQATHSVRPIMSRIGTTMKRLVGRVEEISVHDFRVKFRDGLNAGNWRRHGEELLRHCAAHEQPVLLVIDELPIYLKRVLPRKDGVQQVDEFLSWLRGVLQGIGYGSLVLIVSGSIGLTPIVNRLGIPDRINHLYPFRLGPWDRDTSVACFRRLAESYELQVEDDVANAVYDALGVGIPYHVQSFFARLRDHATKLERGVKLEDVQKVRKELLGPSGQNDLAHYKTRLNEALEDENHTIAMEILAEAATQEVFTPGARRCLEGLYAGEGNDARRRIEDILEILMHDGYLEDSDDGHRFSSHLLKDWWSWKHAYYIPLENRHSDGKLLGDAQ